VRPAEDLAGSLEALASLPIDYTLGHHDLDDFHWAEVVVRNPAVPRESPWLAVARERGARVETEMTLFFRECAAPIAAITGTKGKTTTTALLHAMLRQRWPESKVAGNMGRSALAEVETLDPNIPIALEISSFQLEALDEHKLAPHVAVLTNISEDHLDRYASFDAYAEVKASIAAHQGHEDWLVVPADDARVVRLTGNASARRVVFGGRPLPGRWALWHADGRFIGRWNDGEVDLGPVNALRVPGEHSWMNALAAAGGALALGVAPAEIRRAIEAFTGVADRLEFVATIAGVDYINDTGATAPAAAIAALRAFADRRLIVIAGGSDKRLPLNDLARALASGAERVILLDGSATPRLSEALTQALYDRADGPYSGMQAAVERAADIAQPGMTVLLSPGCASFGMFRDEFHRGAAFRHAVATVAALHEVESSPR
jgi:UDP-N-acetylmuramoylalanine--D-glutamate ligase